MPQAAQDAPIFRAFRYTWLNLTKMALPDIAIANVSEPNRRSQKEGLRLKKMASKDESREATHQDAEAENVPFQEAQRAASLRIPAHQSISTFGSTSGSVWSSNRWLSECKAGLRATESKCWSQLLQSLTGEPVKWSRPGAKGPRPQGPRAPNQRRLVKNAVHGILIRRPNQRVSEDHRRFKKEASRESVAFDVEEEQIERENSIDVTRKSLSTWACNMTAHLHNIF